MIKKFTITKEYFGEDDYYKNKKSTSEEVEANDIEEVIRIHLNEDCYGFYDLSDFEDGVKDRLKSLEEEGGFYYIDCLHDECYIHSDPRDIDDGFFVKINLKDNE